MSIGWSKTWDGPGDAVSHTPHDTNLIKGLDGSTDVEYPVRGWIPDTSGTVAIVNSAGTTVSVPVIEGVTYPIPTKRILDTGTDSTVVVCIL